MKKAISYALFGYGQGRHQDCFDFHSYLRGMMLSIRMNRLIYPGWETVIHIDYESHKAFRDLFEKLDALPDVRIVLCEQAPLCKAMLWRLKPVFEKNTAGRVYSHVICRDLDSPTTYRDAQCVQQWMKNEKAAHAITDSVSHTIPMMGGMIGFVTSSFEDHTGFTSWDQMFANKSYDFNRKGSDQDFLNREIYPFFAQHGRDSITQHYIKGMPNTFLSDYNSSVPSERVAWLSDEMEQSNDVCGHIGASGWYETAMFKFLRQHWDMQLHEIEKSQGNIFYWGFEI